MLTTTDFLAALQIAAFAIVFAEMLTAPKMIFSRYGRWLDELERTRPGLAYPLGYCSKCLAGQVALWLFPILNAERIARFPIQAIAAWISFVSVAILAAALVSALWAFLKR
jgi:hypothetical protein